MERFKYSEPLTFLMHSHMMKKNSIKQKFNKFVIMGLILTESILISCERCNNDDNNKGVNMVSQSTKEIEHSRLSTITYSKTQQEKNVTLNEKYAKIPNTNFSAKISGNEIHIKEGEKTYKLENSKNFSHIFENNGIIYLTGVNEGYLHFSSYEKSLKEKRDFSFQLISSDEKIVSHSINFEEDKLTIKGEKEGGKSNEIDFNIRLNSLNTFRNFYGTLEK